MQKIKGQVREFTQKTLISNRNEILMKETYVEDFVKKLFDENLKEQMKLDSKTYEKHK